MLWFCFQNQFESKLGYFVSLPDDFGFPNLKVHVGVILTEFEHMNLASYSLYTGRSPFTWFHCAPFCLMWLENLLHLLNLRSNVWFNAIWHRPYTFFNMIWHTWSVATHVLFWCHCHIYGLIMLVICGWCSSPFNSIGFCYQNEWGTYIHSLIALLVKNW
jgi:hypothetical protein